MTEDKIKTKDEGRNKEPKQCCSVRTVLWYLVFTGMAVNYMTRINLNIALVSMVLPKSKTGPKLVGACIAGEYVERMPHSMGNETENFTNTTSISIAYRFNETITTMPPLILSKQFDWNEKEQGRVLGSFFWFHWVTQIPGGLLAAKYGTKKVYGIANFLGAVCCFAIPFCSYQGALYLILIRALQGLVCGFCWPAVHDLTAKWIPPNQRSKFVTAYMGSSVGVALTYAVCGFIIDKWGWELVFYLSGVVGTLWYIAWLIFVYDSPSQHPRISEEEKKYILQSLGQSIAKKKAPVPWGDILTCPTVWMNAFAQIGGTWGLFTLVTHGPMYFNYIHGWNIRATGLFSGMPHLLRMIFAVIFSQLGDYLLSSEKLSRSGVRKLATVLCCIVQGVFMMGLSFSGCDRIAAIVFLTLAVASHGAVSTGPLASVVDISPNYASVILGILNTVVACVGFLTPAVVGYLTFNNQTIEQWQKVFWITSALLCSSGIVYLIFTKSELHSWNSPKDKKNKQESEKMVKDKGEKELAIVIFGSELEI